jgi:hypothetical protein
MRGDLGKSGAARGDLGKSGAAWENGVWGSLGLTVFDNTCASVAYSFGTLNCYKSQT